MYAPEEDPNTLAECPACKWRGRAGDSIIDVDQIRRCPVKNCRSPLERFCTDPPTVLDSAEYYSPMI